MSSIHHLVGQTLGQYELRELLGVGGMGAVYRGFQAALKREVAVKIMTPDVAQQAGYIERFNREAETAASLEHPNIIPIYDYGTQRGISYVVMRLLTGGGLDDRLWQHTEEGKPLPSLSEVAHVLTQLASALDYAHSFGVIHRDIKPSNVMFDNQGRPYLVDFGIAKLVEATSVLTGSGVALGTPTHMAPEQWRAADLTPAADQYALGVMAYSLVTGRVPFSAPTPYALMHKHLHELPTPPQTIRVDLPPALNSVLNRTLEKLPQARFPTCTAFAQAFEAAIAGSSGTATQFFTAPVRRKPVPKPQPSPVPSAQFASSPGVSKDRRGWLVWVLIAVIVIMAGVIGVLLLGGDDESPAETAGAALVPTAPATENAVVIVPSATPTETHTVTPLPPATATATPTPTPSPTPTETPSTTPTETPTTTPSATATSTATATPTPEPTDTPSPTPTASATSTPTPTLTPTPTHIPTNTPFVIQPLSQSGRTTFYSTQFIPGEESTMFQTILASSGGDIEFVGTDESEIFNVLVSEAGQETGSVDVIGALHGTFIPLAQENVVYDVTGLVENLEAQVDIPDAYVELSKLGTADFQYYIPWMQATYIMVAHVDALQYLPAGADINALTWDEFARWGENIYNATGERKLGFPVDGLWHRFIMGYLYPSFTGGMVTTFNSSEAVAMFQFLRDDVWSFVNERSENYTFMQDPLLSGEVWVAFDHTARLREAFQQQPGNFVAFPAPAGPAGRGFMPIIVGLGIPVNAENPEGAIALTQFLLEPEVQGSVLTSLGFFPVVNGVDTTTMNRWLAIEADAVSQQSNMPDALPALLPVGLGVYGGEFNDIYRDTANRILFNGEDIQTVLDDEAVALQNLLDTTGAACWAPDPPSNGVCQVE